MTKPSVVPVIIALAPWLAAARTALAHGGEAHPEGTIGPRDWDELWHTWGLEPGVIIPLIVTAMLYARGQRLLWRGGPPGRGIRIWEAVCFWSGWLALVIALVSPLHPWGSVLFSAHMTQHEILMLVAAPLLVLGRPLIAFLRALPRPWARTAVRWSRVPWYRRACVVLTNPFVAWLIHAAVLWGWHVPALFQATIDNELIHAIQHLSFLLSALLFWWAIVQTRPRAIGYGVAVAYLFTTALHSGLLGALITLTRAVWYPAYRQTSNSWGLTPLEDQQLGGLIMWVPACTIYVIAGIVLLAAWLRESEIKVRSWEARISGVAPEARVPRSSHQARAR
jgi:putative membrane protein